MCSTLLLPNNMNYYCGVHRVISSELTSTGDCSGETLHHSSSIILCTSQLFSTPIAGAGIGRMCAIGGSRSAAKAIIGTRERLASRMSILYGCSPRRRQTVGYGTVRYPACTEVERATQVRTVIVHLIVMGSCCLALENHSGEDVQYYVCRSQSQRCGEWRVESANKCDIPLFSYATYVRTLS